MLSSSYWNEESFVSRSPFRRSRGTCELSCTAIAIGQCPWPMPAWCGSRRFTTQERSSPWIRVFASIDVTATRSSRYGCLIQRLYNLRMSALRALPLAITLAKLVAAQQTISFPTQDGGRICANLYGKGDRAVVLAHGGRFNKESWRNQAGAGVRRIPRPRDRLPWIRLLKRSGPG